MQLDRFPNLGNFFPGNVQKKVPDCGFPIIVTYFLTVLLYKQSQRIVKILTLQEIIKL